MTAASQPILLDSSFPAEREPRTPAESTLPARVSRVSRSSRAACSARTKRRKGRSRNSTCHQLRFQNRAENPAT